MEIIIWCYWSKELLIQIFRYHLESNSKYHITVGKKKSIKEKEKIISELSVTRLLLPTKVHLNLIVTSIQRQKYEHWAIKISDGNLSSRHTQETNKTSLWAGFYDLNRRSPGPVASKCSTGQVCASELTSDTGYCLHSHTQNSAQLTASLRRAAG